MPPTENSKIIRVILPTEEEITAYYDRSTVPGNWRNAETDEIVTEWSDGLQVKATLYGGEPFYCYWNASLEWAWRGVDSDPDDVALTAEEIGQIDVVDLRVD
jgi:hypothetical protein